MATAIPWGLVGRKSLTKLRAGEQKHLIWLGLEARWPRASKPGDLTGRVNNTVM